MQELAALAARLDGVKALSIYLDWSDVDLGHRERWRVVLKQRLAALRASLTHSPHAERVAFEACTARLLSLLPPLGETLEGWGWMGFATATGATHAESLPVAVPTAVTWDNRLRIAPCVGAAETRPALVVVVDHHHAVFHRYERLRLSRIEELVREEHVSITRPMQDVPRAGFHTGTRGTAARDDASRQLQSAYKRFRAEVQRRIAALDRNDTWLVLAGAPEVVTHVAGDLPSIRRARTHVAREIGAAPSGMELAEGVARAVEALLRARVGGEIATVVADAARGARAALGAAPVAAALQRGAVDLLLLTRRLITDDPDTAERLVRAALAEGGRVEEVRGADAEALERAGGGIAAALRFALTPVASAVPPGTTADRERAASP